MDGGGVVVGDVAEVSAEVALASGAQFACQQQPSAEIAGREGAETICYLPFAARVLCHFNFRRGHRWAGGQVGVGRWVLLWAPEPAN